MALGFFPPDSIGNLGCSYLLVELTRIENVVSLLLAYNTTSIKPTCHGDAMFVICLQVKHDLNGITTLRTDLKGLFNPLLCKTKPVGYQRLDIYFPSPEKFNTEWPCIPIPKYPYNINLPDTQQAIAVIGYIKI